MLVQDKIPPYVFEDLGDVTHEGADGSTVVGYSKPVKAFVVHDESIRLSEPLPRLKEAPLPNGSSNLYPSPEDAAAKEVKAPAEKSSDATTAKEASSFVQKPTKDIGREGYQRDVFHFVREDTNVQPTPFPRKETPFEYNGSDESSHAQLPKKDIGEQGIDPEVHGMTSANNMVLPIPHRRPDAPYLPNGSNPKSQPSFIGVRFL